ncbi:helix-turn-helix transcriptional regulator [Clostridium sp. D2Q-14]|uniref:helix-turn-helix domain-containing protein n=1 Tax=Anaeromonas gelatinilytica TaxID=2683194 RepID=UPI00193BC46E|nr:helix-turn-helix transcriptional regulator [Anaeromonas gelatinilytica]MBS4535604.1 helix-turn-helix transcriptional regulator [Anaeromonas gelatinilytica]
MNQKLKKMREDKGYTQEYMAHKLGYKGKSGYCLLENGSVKLSVEKAIKIAEVLEVDPSIFFTSKVEDTSTRTSETA